MAHKSKRKNESNTHPNDALRLLYFRCILDLTQKQAADLLDVPKSSYREYEKGRLPVPVQVRRKIGSLSPVDILPMDPDQDPKDVYAVVRRAQPEEFSDELKRLLPRIAPSERHSGHKPSDKSPLVQGPFSLSLVEIRRRKRNDIQAQRQIMSPLRRLYFEWRDASFFASAIFTFLWINCLQLSIPLGIFTDAANVVGVGSIAVFFLLLIAVSQDMFSNMVKPRAP